ncbi:MAG: acetate kinase [Pseudomonadota bacterium]
MGPTLVLNTGSSSIKYAVFEGAQQQTAGQVEQVSDHAEAMGQVMSAVSSAGLSAVAHRVVHGGTEFSGPVLIDGDVEARIEALCPLAPLHNPVALAAIRAIRAEAPDLPQIAAFDTAFHRTIPEIRQLYALPASAAANGIRRYGFHGLSYAGLTRKMPELAGLLPDRLLACHLGNGASLCAIKSGQSVATTMGYSPVSGLTMGTRVGEIDANAVLRLAALHGAEKAALLLNNRSGLMGLGGLSDMRALGHSGLPEAARAIEHFAETAIMQAGAMIAAMGGCDAVAFTGGIGENDAGMRARIMAGLGWLGLTLDSAANSGNAPCISGDGPVSAWIVPAEEEAEIARQSQMLLS